MNSTSGKLALYLVCLVMPACAFCGAMSDPLESKQQLGVAVVDEDPNVVARIGDYLITKQELSRRLMNELRPEPYESGTKVELVNAEIVLKKMIAEKAMIIEARKSGLLQSNEEIRTSVKQIRDRNLANSLLQKYLQSKQADLMVTDAEIDQALKTDPKLDRTRAQANLQRTKANRLLDNYYQQLYKKLNVQKVSANFARAGEIHQRLLYRPKEPRNVGWIQNNQVRNELTPEEKNIVLAAYDKGKVTLEDWLIALCEIVPPGRPQDLNTAQGVERLLDRVLRIPIFVAEAESLGLDKDESMVQQVRQYEDMRLLGAAQMAIYRQAAEPNEQEVIAYFNKNKGIFGTPRRLKIDQIWCQDLKTARQAKAELDGGKDFESVKKEFSLQKQSQPFDTSPDSEGMFFNDLWQADPNTVIGPVKGFYSDGVKWRIVKILGKKPAEQKEYSSDIKDQVKQRTLDEKRNAAFAKYRQELLDKYPHKIYADRVKDIDPLALEKETEVVSEDVRSEPKTEFKEIEKGPKTEFEEARKDISSLERFVRTQSLHTLPKAFQQEVEDTFASLLLSSDLKKHFVIGDFLNVGRKTIPDREKGSVTISESGSKLVRFELEYPKDRQPFGAGGGSLPVGHGSIWRFKGQVTNIMGFDFEGRQNDPLRFILVDRYGLVYLYGTGTVVLKDGTVVTLPKD